MIVSFCTGPSRVDSDEKRASSVAAPARIVLVGVRGFGQVHAERIARLTDQGLVELVAAVDPGVVLDPPLIYGVDLYADLAEALSAVGPVDVVIIAAPLSEHFRLAHTALTAGADVYLEKPPVTSMDDFTQLLDLEQETGASSRSDSRASVLHALEMLRTDAFGIGPVVRLGAVGAWSRTVGYWTRSPWAGRRSLKGRAVVDGVVTNPLAHAVATALAIVDCRQAGGRRVGGDRSLPRQRHRQRRHLGGPDPHHRRAAT